MKVIMGRSCGRLHRRSKMSSSQSRTRSMSPEQIERSEGAMAYDITIDETERAEGVPKKTRSNPFTGLLPIMRKEAIHIRRDPMALFFTVLIPMIQLFMIGYAINTNVRDI